MRTFEDRGDLARARSRRESRRGAGAPGAAPQPFPSLALLVSGGLLTVLTACSGSNAMGPPLGSGGIGLGGVGGGASAAAGAPGAPGSGGMGATGSGGASTTGGGGASGPGAGGAGAIGGTGSGGRGSGTAGTGVGGIAAGSGGRGPGGRSGAGSGGAAAGAGGSMTTAGSGGAGGATSEIPAGYVPAIMGVGYGGVRIVSRDGGKTWGDRSIIPGSKNDDEGLLRAVAYGKGLWIATGWKYLTSTDGINWTDHGLLDDGSLKGCRIVEGLTYANGSFYAACASAPSVVYRSSDGSLSTWTKIGTIGNTDGHVYLTYRGGKFVAYGDNKTTYQSTDAVTWTVMDGVSEGTYCLGSFMNRTDCHQAAWFEEGFWLNVQWGGTILRSTDGKKFDTVFMDEHDYTVYQGRVFTAGYVAPH